MSGQIKISILSTVLVGVIFLFSGWISSTSGGAWMAPTSSKTINNPLEGDVQTIKSGKKLFTNMCVICHGNKGRGDGVAGMALNPRPANLSLPSVQDQTDGEIFWKITEGRAPMASYKDILSEDQRWQLVNYMRTFKK